jgi:hypothetical protein
MNLNKSIYMLTNEWHIKKPNSDFVVISKAIKKSFLFKLLKKLSLLLCLPYSKKVLLRFNPLISCRCSIDISLIKRQIWLLVLAKSNLTLSNKVCFFSFIRTDFLWKSILLYSSKEVFHSTNSCPIILLALYTNVYYIYILIYTINLTYQVLILT